MGQDQMDSSVVKTVFPGPLPTSKPLCIGLSIMLLIWIVDEATT